MLKGDRHTGHCVTSLFCARIKHILQKVCPHGIVTGLHMRDKHRLQSKSRFSTLVFRRFFGRVISILFNSLVRETHKSENEFPSDLQPRSSIFSTPALHWLLTKPSTKHTRRTKIDTNHRPGRGMKPPRVEQFHGFNNSDARNFGYSTSIIFKWRPSFLKYHIYIY